MKTKLSIITYIIICTGSIYADEFFEAGSTIGGYGELHWNKAYDIDGNETSNKLDFHRFIIYYGHSWTEEWSFKSELELEHKCKFFKSSYYCQEKSILQKSVDSQQAAEAKALTEKRLGCIHT